MEVKGIFRYLRYGAIACLAVASLAASEQRGVVKFGTVPVPGATVTATQADKKVVAVTDQQGVYSFPDLADGIWNIQVEMLCFATLKKDIGVAPDSPPAEWSLTMLGMDDIKPSSAPAPPPTTAAATTAKAPGAPAAATPGAGGDKPPSIIAANAAANAANNAKNTSNAKNSKNAPKGKPGATPPAGAQPGFQRAAVNATSDAPPPDNSAASSSIASADSSASASEAMVVNGSSSNGIERRAIGNFRKGPGSLYNGGLNFVVDNSALDAQPFSVSGIQSPKPSVNHLTGGINWGGPLIVPHVFRWNGNFFLNYQASRQRNATNQSGLMPTNLERGGDFSQSFVAGKPVELFDPTTGNPIPNNLVPSNSISSQAKALLAFYPKPMFTIPGAAYNFQVPIVNRSDTDTFQARVNKTINNKNFLNTGFTYQSQRGLNPNLFGFIDTSRGSGMQANASIRHTFTRTIYASFTANFTRSTNTGIPFFALKQNISGQIGITGNDQTPGNWGPPNLSFTGGISGLSDGQESKTRNQTEAFGIAGGWLHRPHNITFVADYRPQQFNPISQQNGRGTYTFNGTATQQIVNGVPVLGTGSGLADMLMGVVDTTNIAFGNADKYLRSAQYDAGITDDWRVNSVLSLNIGLRWEYGAPITELYGRLVNLDIANFYGNAAAVTAASPVGPLTGIHYPDSLVHPDKHAFEPRLSFAWHPFFGASTLFRGGYGVYYDTSVFNALANRIAQQAPFSKSLSLQNSPANPLTLGNGFYAAPNTLTNNFAIDPNFRVGYSQNWEFSVQQNLTGSMVLIAKYQGVKGTRTQQAFAPNTYPTGVVNPCAACLSGYEYRTSNGNSTREAGIVQIRRRFHSGFSTGFTYTYSKSIDDANPGGQGGGGSLIAQDWLHLNQERGLSSFDQRHLLNITMQYSTGTGIRGGALLGGWRGAIFKGWTITSNINLGTGLPLTPLYPAPTGHTGISGPLRPEYTGQSVYDSPAGLFLNPAAYAVPAVGQWGNAGRNSITGPSMFNMTMSMARSFDRFSLSFDSRNPINHVTYPSWGTTIGNSQFGVPLTANGMRTVQATLRIRIP